MLTLAYTGMRYGECAALRVVDVDVQGPRVKVSRPHQVRVVSVPRRVAAALAEQVQGKAPEDLVFPGADGGWMPLDWFAWCFEKACVTAGLQNVIPKTLRHTAGSLALASGQPVTTAQKLLGHKSAMTTMNVYSHMLPDGFDNLTAAMDAAMGALEPTPTSG